VTRVVAPLDLSILTLGTNVFGWTANQRESFAVLDAFVEAGGTSIDTADVYSYWGDGNIGGESEAVIGQWLTAHGARDQVKIATKVGAPGGQFGAAPSLAPDAIRARFEASLQRLGCDSVDLLYLHAEDPSTPVEQIADTLDDLVSQGLVSACAVSNFSAESLRALHEASTPAAAPVAIQSHWSLMADAFERDLLPTCAELGVQAIPFWGLEKGFLTGKYRDAGHQPTTEREQRHRPFDLLDERGARVLDALDVISAEHGVSVAAVALGWLAAQPQVASVVASARTPQQLGELMQVADVELSAEQVALLDAARRTE
jgi:aryl-alcohol dehydrogenase-like predicted oxidoreductase